MFWNNVHVCDGNKSKTRVCGWANETGSTTKKITENYGKYKSQK